jgi:hypothetical protein
MTVQEYFRKFVKNANAKSPLHKKEYVRKAVAYLLTPYDNFIADFMCLAHNSGASCHRRVLGIFDDGPRLTQETTFLIRYHARNPNTFLHWAEDMLVWSDFFNNNRLEPRFESHVYMKKWFDDILSYIPVGLEQLREAWHAYDCTIGDEAWKKSIQDFSEKNNTPILKYVKSVFAVEFLIALLTSVCHIRVKNRDRMFNLPVVWSSVAEILVWAIDWSESRKAPKEQW